MNELDFTVHSKNSKDIEKDRVEHMTFFCIHYPVGEGSGKEIIVQGVPYLINFIIQIFRP